MSEQTKQNDLYTYNVHILDKYECLSLGATTINNLIDEKKIKAKKINSKNGDNLKKPDVLIIDKNRNIIVYQEHKLPSSFDTDIKKENAIKQEINVAKKLGAKIFIATDTENFIWINPLTGKQILDVNGNEIKFQLKPKEQDNRKIVKLIDDILISIDSKNNQILKKEYLDPTDLAQKINGILKNLTFASAKMSLYTFVEVFLFKYLSDIKILKDEDSFNYIYNLYKKDGYDDAKILGKYLDGPRETMKKLFPAGKDGTSIINGQVFHVQRDSLNNYISVDNTAKIFKQVILEFKKYENKNDKFINISRDFKSKLFETFMKNSDDKADMGQFFTPLKVVKEMVSMVDVKKGISICDPACGVGKFLLESVEDNLDEFFTVDGKGNLVKNINIIGYDKMMSENDDITIILAKANMLIYFSKLFTNCRDAEELQKIADELLNSTFKLSKTLLGTLDSIENNKYDLIFANPPYYQSKVMTAEAKKTGEYEWGGAGVEGLFLEWIVKSLNYSGVANVVLPDGIFSNLQNNTLKENILLNCYIDSIISLPKATFFTTPKKTYILTLRKKTKKEIQENKKQGYPVFTYICNSIGEELNVNRFDTPNDNDLHEAVCKYNNYKALRNNMPDFFKEHLKLDKKFKEIPIEEFKSNGNWTIENWWSDKEKIDIGLKEEKKAITIHEFQQSLEEAKKLLDNVKSDVEKLKSDNTIKYETVRLERIFDFSITSNTNLTKKFVQQHKGTVPVYGSSKISEEVSYGYIEDNIDGIKYFDDCLTINRNGSAGYVFYRENHFCINEDVTPLIIFDKYEKFLDKNYLLFEIEKITIEKFSHVKKAGKTFLKDIEIQIPIKENGEFDVDIQHNIAEKYLTIKNAKTKILDKVNKIIEKEIEF